QADIDALPFAGDASLVQGGQRPDGGVQRGGAVDDGNSGPHGRHALVTGHHGDPRHGLADGIVADLIAIGAELPVGGDVDHDDAGIERLEDVVAEAHLLDGPGRKFCTSTSETLISLRRTVLASSLRRSMLRLFLPLLYWTQYALCFLTQGAWYRVSSP